MIYDTRPEAGEVAEDLGHGVTVVKRDPPRTSGAAWVAPYAVNCAAHGWIVSRATVAQCREAGGQHIAADHRAFDAGRKAQGFRSQAHLDAHYAHVDHERACAECGQPGPAVWLEGDASWQPASAQCATGRALFLASYSENFAAA